MKKRILFFVAANLVMLVRINAQKVQTLNSPDDNIRVEVTIGQQLTEGLIPGNRLYVHLSPDKETAMKVGTRHGTPYVICIDCKRMVSDGCKFWKSNNGVWLTEQVNPKYFKENDP